MTLKTKTFVRYRRHSKANFQELQKKHTIFISKHLMKTQLKKNQKTRPRLMSVAFLVSAGLVACSDLNSGTPTLSSSPHSHLGDALYGGSLFVIDFESHRSHVDGSIRSIQGHLSRGTRCERAGPGSAGGGPRPRGPGSARRSPPSSRPDGNCSLLRPLVLPFLLLHPDDFNFPRN